MSAKKTYDYGLSYGIPERDAMAIGWYRRHTHEYFARSCIM